MDACPYWDPESLAQLSQATTFAQIGNIALSVLRKFPSEFHGAISQVCGPITSGGFGFERNLLVFRSAVQTLRRSGVVLFDQTPLERHISPLARSWKGDPANRGKYCQPILDEIYLGLFESGLVSELVFLPHEGSVGSAWEKAQARRLGMSVTEYPNPLYLQILREHDLTPLPQ